MQKTTVYPDGPAVRAARGTRTQAELAGAIGYTQPWLAKVEAGTPCSRRSLVQLALATGTPYETLVRPAPVIIPDALAPTG